MLETPTKKGRYKAMPKYIYKFCDGSVSEVEVSDEHYALLRSFDARERLNNLRQKRRNSSLPQHIKRESKLDTERDKDFTEANE